MFYTITFLLNVVKVNKVRPFPKTAGRKCVFQVDRKLNGLSTNFVSKRPGFDLSAYWLSKYRAGSSPRALLGTLDPSKKKKRQE